MNQSVLAQSESIKELATALSKAQGELMSAKKDSLNPHFRSKYADLASIWDACRKPLANHGLAIVQFPGDYNGKEMSLTTRITHSSGEWLEHTMKAPVIKPDPQGIGSCLTYMRRYSLAAVTGVYQDDDDGNAASLPVNAKKEEQLIKLKTITSATPHPVINEKPALQEPEKKSFPDFPGKKKTKKDEPISELNPPPIEDLAFMPSDLNGLNTEPSQDPFLNDDSLVIPFGKNKGFTYVQVGPEMVAKSLWAAKKGIIEKEGWVEKVGRESVNHFINSATQWLEGKNG